LPSAFNAHGKIARKNGEGESERTHRVTS